MGGVITKLEKIRRRFLWCEPEGKRKVHYFHLYTAGDYDFEILRLILQWWERWLGHFYKERILKMGINIIVLGEQCICVKDTFQMEIL